MRSGLTTAALTLAWLFSVGCPGAEPEEVVPEAPAVDPALAAFCDPIADLQAREGEVVTPEDVAAVLGPGEVIPYIDTQTQRTYLDGEATAIWENADSTLFMVDRFFVCPGDF